MKYGLSRPCIWDGMSKMCLRVWFRMVWVVCVLEPEDARIALKNIGKWQLLWHDHRLTYRETSKSKSQTSKHVCFFFVFQDTCHRFVSSDELLYLFHLIEDWQDTKNNIQDGHVPVVPFNTFTLFQSCLQVKML